MQIWNTWREGGEFRDGRRWLLRFFDQIRFHPVSAAELLHIRAGFVHGRHPLRIEQSTLSLGEYRRFLADNAASIDAFRRRQRTAFEAERGRWRAAGFADTPVTESAPASTQAELPAGCLAVRAPVSGSVWQLRISSGQQVSAGEELLVMEAMKMEISVKAQQSGVIADVYCAAGKPAAAGETLLALRPASA